MGFGGVGGANGMAAALAVEVEVPYPLRYRYSFCRASNKLTIHVATLPSLNTGYCAKVLGSCWERPIPSRK